MWAYINSNNNLVKFSTFALIQYILEFLYNSISHSPFSSIQPYQLPSFDLAFTKRKRQKKSKHTKFLIYILKTDYNKFSYFSQTSHFFTFFLFLIHTQLNYNFHIFFFCVSHYEIYKSTPVSQFNNYSITITRLLCKITL
jgi:hypothetical protein